MRHSILVISLAALCIASRSAAFADVVVLQNGNELQGEIIQETENRVVLRFSGGTLQIRRADIAEVRRQDRATYLFEEGEKQLTRGDLEDALETFAELLAADPDSERVARRMHETRLAFAASLRDHHRYREALEQYRHVLRSRPDDETAREEIEAIAIAEREVAAEERRALEELRTGEVDTAVWRLQNIYARYPDRRREVAVELAGALAAQGLRLREEGRFTEACARLAESISIAPTQVEKLRGVYADCRLREITPSLESGDYETVERLAREGLEIAPACLPLSYYLAVAHDARGEADEAVEVYASITGKRPPGRAEEVVGTLRRLAEEKVRDPDGSVFVVGNPQADETLPGEYRELETEHFVVIHRNPRVAREVGFVAERAYSQLFKLLACQTHWRERCRIHLFASVEEYHEKVQLGEWSGAAHRLQSRRGAFSRHEIFSYQGQPRLTDGLLVHEIAHALLLHRLNYPREVPLWANEGFAVWCEPEYMHRHYARLVEIEKGRDALLRLREVTSRESYPDGRVDLFYGQSWSLTAWLVAKRGLPVYLDLLVDLTRGSSLKDALERHYRLPGLAALENAWRASVERP